METRTKIKTDNIAADTSSRFSGFSWADKDIIKSLSPITVVGAGGIGSWFTLLASRVGYKIVIYDNDIVERHNIGGQLYYTKSIMRKKVDTLSRIIQDFSPQGEVLPVDVFVDENTLINTKIIISAVDNMKARNIIYNSFTNHLQEAFNDGYTISENGLYLEHSDGYNLACLFIDGRLLAEQFQVYAVTPKSLSRYAETLFSDDELEEEACSIKQTSHFAAGIAFNMIRVLNNYVANFIDPDCGREVPFSIIDDGLLIMPTIEL